MKEGRGSAASALEGEEGGGIPPVLKGGDLTPHHPLVFCVIDVIFCRSRVFIFGTSRVFIFGTSRVFICSLCYV